MGNVPTRLSGHPWSAQSGALLLDPSQWRAAAGGLSLLGGQDLGDSANSWVLHQGELWAPPSPQGLATQQAVGPAAAAGELTSLGGSQAKNGTRLQLPATGKEVPLHPAFLLPKTFLPLPPLLLTGAWQVEVKNPGAWQVEAPGLLAAVGTAGALRGRRCIAPGPLGIWAGPGVQQTQGWIRGRA